MPPSAGPTLGLGSTSPTSASSNSVLSISCSTSTHDFFLLITRLESKSEGERTGELFPNVKPAKPGKAPCWVGAGDVDGDDDEAEVVGLRGEWERGSSVRRVGECEKAVRSFWRDLDGERRRVVVVGMVADVLCVVWAV